METTGAYPFQLRRRYEKILKYGISDSGGSLEYICSERIAPRTFLYYYVHDFKY
jgi:hypothetical protein